MIELRIESVNSESFSEIVGVRIGFEEHPSNVMPPCQSCARQCFRPKRVLFTPTLRNMWHFSDTCQIILAYFNYLLDSELLKCVVSNCASGTSSITAGELIAPIFLVGKLVESIQFHLFATSHF